MPQKILQLLPIEFDHAEVARLDQNEYDVHFFYASEARVEKDLAPLDYGEYLAEPGFLVSYVEKAVRYVKENGITAIMFGHDMASIVASVVCEQTGLPGPSLDSTFLCLHKFYARKRENGKFWFDYIDMDKPCSEWKGKIRYPCFLKAPFLTSSKGHCCVKNDAEMEIAVANLTQCVAPFFTGYCEFFRRFLDLEKFPLAIKNIASVEELVDSSDQWSIEGWMDGDANFTMFTAGSCEISLGKPGRLVNWVIPQFLAGAIDGERYKKLVKYTEMMGQRFGLTHTFYDVEFWQKGNQFTLIKINSRMAYTYSVAYRKMWGIGAYKAALYLACGQTEKLRQLKTSSQYKPGELISSQFFIFTSGNGKGKDFMSYDYAREGSISDGAYNTAGPGMTISVKEETPVRQTTTIGVRLCDFFLTGKSPSELFERANLVKTKLMKREEDRDLLKMHVAE